VREKVVQGRTDERGDIALDVLYQSMAELHVELYSKEESKACLNRVLLVPVLLAILVSVSNASRSSTALTEHVYALFINCFSVEVTIARKL